MNTYLIGYYEEESGAHRFVEVQAENEDEARRAVIRTIDGDVSKFSRIQLITKERP